MSVSDVPLLNDYKKEFVKKRLPQTFLGGPNLRLGFTAPWYVYFLQILAWISPWIICGIFTILTEISGVNIAISACVAGGIIGLFVLSIQIVHFCKSKVSDVPIGTETKLTASQHLRHLLADNDDIDFDSAFSYTTFEFIFPPLRFKFAIIFHVLFSGILCGFGVWYTLPSVLNALYSNNTGATVVIYIFSWITICIAQYSLNSGGIPPEVATFHSVDLYDVASLSRAFHIFIFFAFHLVEQFVSSFSAVNQVLHIVFLFLPFLWQIGLLPPFDAILVWSAEQVLVFGLGGSPCATDLRLFISLLLSGSVLVGGSFISNSDVLIAYSVGFGYLLSTDIISFFILMFVKLKKRKPSHPIFHFNTKLPQVGVIGHFFVVILIAGCVALGILLRDQAVESGGTSLAIDISFLVLFIVTKILQDIQRVYFFFRLFRNPAYPRNIGSNGTDHTKRKTCLIVCGHIYLFLTTVIIPLLMTVYLVFFVYQPTDTALPSFFVALGLVHAFRMIWNRSSGALVVFVVFSIMRLSLAIGTPSLGAFENFSFGTQILILDICIDRAYKFLDNLWLVIALTITSWSDKKQRRDSSKLLMVLNAVFFPFVLAIVALASVLSAPLLPLFTLPIFLVGFSRQSRFWPDNPGVAPASVCSDTSYYEQMAPGLVAEMIKGIGSGKYGMTTAQGTDLPFYLARSQDKTFWIQTLEVGYGYSSLSVKGLELQETSCHALEATRLDDACSVAFENPESNSNSKRNPYSFLYAVTPIDTVFVDGYSDAKNSLSGIIDYPKALKRFHSDFTKSLIWIMLHLIRKKKQVRVSNIQISEENSAQSGRKSFTFHPLSSSSSKSDLVLPLNNLKPDSSIGKPEKTQTSKLAKNKVDVVNQSSPSMGSVGSILASDSENQRNKTKQESSKKTAPIPGSMDTGDDLWELDSDSSDSGFGVEVKNVFARSRAAENPSALGKPPVVINKTTANDPDVTGWGIPPFLGGDVSSYSKVFDRSWYLYVTSIMDDADWGTEEDLLLSACKEMVSACYVIAHVQGIPGRDPSTIGPGHITKVFKGEIPWSPDLEWLQHRPDLLECVLIANRYAVKLMYDRVAMGTADDEDEAHEEFAASLKDFETSWHIGPENATSWKEALKKGIPSLFSINFELSKNEYNARILLRRAVETHICRLSSASVRSIWANLSLELLYATNDDEERYSIQAHPSLLRNLTVQAADPPLGYPIYSSPPLYANLLP